MDGDESKQGVGRRARREGLGSSGGGGKWDVGRRAAGDRGGFKRGGFGGGLVEYSRWGARVRCGVWISRARARATLPDAGEVCIGSALVLVHRPTRSPCAGACRPD